MNNNNSNALRVIKKHFKSGTELSKELKLYRTIAEEKFATETRAEKFLEAVLRTRSTINESQLRRDKYNLIKELKSTFNVNEFFKSRINNYKFHATAYKLFEYSEADDPKEYISCKFTLCEHIQTQPKNVHVPPSLASEHKDVRILASKLVVDKFNEKYSKLSSEQKRILREYINNVTNSVKLKKYILKETKQLQDTIIELQPEIPSKVVRIKLSEVANLLTKLKRKHTIQDKDVLTMLRYYELVNELKKAGNK